MKRILVLWCLFAVMVLPLAVTQATVSTTAPRNDYIGTGAVATYSYTFRIFAATDLRVTQRDTAGVETALVLTTNYTVTGVNNPNGGTITLVAGSLPTDYTLTIRFDRTPQQSTDLRNQGSFFPETHEDKFDELTRYSQSLRDVVTRSLHYPETETPADTDTQLPSVEERRGGYLGFDLTNGNPIVTGLALTAPPVTAFMATVLDDTTAAAARGTLGVPTLAEAGVQADNIFRITGSSDATKQLALEVDGIATGTTRTVTAQNQSGTMALLTDAFTTGDVKLTLKTIADVSWVLMNDKSIGSASSGATGRANTDTEPLYTLIWTNIIDQWAPVTGGRGASAAADFAANKPLFLPKTLGRALAGYGVGTVEATGVDGDVDITANDLTVTSNNTKWVTGMSVVFTLASGTVTGLTSGNTYYVIRSSATKVQLASSLANAQNNTAIDFTAKSTPVWTITHTYTTRVLGEAVGEQDHAQSLTELMGHTHAGLTGSIVGFVGSGGTRQIAGGTEGVVDTTTGSRGGNAAMNIVQPTVFLNVMVKL
jgi:hypothetical protein